MTGAPDHKHEPRTPEWGKLGSTLRKYRETKHIPGVEVQRRTGIAVANLYGTERGERPLTLINTLKLLDVYDVHRQERLDVLTLLALAQESTRRGRPNQPTTESPSGPGSG